MAYHLTYDTIAKVLKTANTEFGIGLGEKTCFTVTDSGANFVKVFKHFSMEETEELVLPVHTANNEDETNDDEIAFEEINDLLATHDAEADEAADYKLPPHRRYASHLLNLVAMKDAEHIDGVLKRTSVQTFAKLQGLWNK